MRMILVGALIVASAGFAAAQVTKTTVYDLSSGTTRASIRADRMESRPNGTYAQGVTLTVGDFVITADDATITGENEIQLGGNARVRIPTK